MNRLTDCYNAVSMLHQIPLGEEDLTRYAGPPRLIRAAGTELFDTISDGIGVIEHPDPGEVVWCDDAGVTCRRWNWRQARRGEDQPGSGRPLGTGETPDVRDGGLAVGPARARRPVRPPPDRRRPDA